MIRINLLQIKRKKKPKPLPSFLILTVLFAVAAVLACVFFYFNQKGKVSTLKATKAANQVRIEDLKKKIAEVDDYESKIKKFQDRKGVIEGLRKNQSGPVKFLNEISFVLPEGVWLSDMTIKSAKVDVKGYAFTNTNVVEFVNNLKRSPMFTEVYLEESKETTVEKVEVYEFKIKFMIKG